MKLFNWDIRYAKSVLIVALLTTLIWSVTGCGDLGQFPTPTPSPTAEKVTPTVISTADRAVLAVYEHLLSQAESHKAKLYLAEFCATCDNWTAKSETFKDGSSIWYVMVDMTSSKIWKWKPYWQQASWFILRNGKVMPSNRLQANALRIEADLQELSLQPQP